jgi:DNA invertase Pin-like site-specific DNA recombinase
MRVGYGRISTDGQSLEPQLDALKAAGCDRIFSDTLSGAKIERPGLTEVLEFLRPGDALVVWKLDRLGRSLKHLIEVMGDLDRQSITFISLTEQVDTSTSGGKLIFHVFGALAEFERDLIRERTRAGLAAARARGRRGGHPRSPAVDTSKKVAIAQALYDDQRNGIADICQTLGVSRATLYRYIRTGRGEAMTTNDPEKGAT